MYEALSVTVIFWCTFVFSAGPFWIATMEAAPHTSFQRLYTDYVLYLIFGWLPLLIVICLVTNAVGKLNPAVFVALHLVGGLVILYLAFKILRTKITTGRAFNFDWKSMSLLSWSNPKVWVLVPAGFLAANLTNNVYLNVAFYYFSGIPFFLFGVFFWGMIGRGGAKISFHYVSYFNAALLSAFGLYLIYSGIKLLP